MSNPCYTPAVPPTQPLVVPALTAAARATSAGVNQTGVSRNGYGSAIVLLQVGASTGTPASFSVTAKLQQSSVQGSGYADVTDSQTVVITTVNTDGQVVVPLAGSGQYVRVVLIPNLVGGVAPTITCSASLVLTV